MKLDPLRYVHFRKSMTYEEKYGSTVTLGLGVCLEMDSPKYTSKTDLTILGRKEKIAKLRPLARASYTSKQKGGLTWIQYCSQYRTLGDFEGS